MRLPGTLLVANRGEIAVRIVRTLRRLGMGAVAVYSDADAGAKHVRESDFAIHIGPSRAADSYLNIEALVGAANRARAQAVHPGYGFLSESSSFAAAVLEAGLVWIGPSPEPLAVTGDKLATRRLFERAGFPVLPGGGPYISVDAALEAVAGLEFPLIVKAVSGGGGISLRVVENAAELERAFEASLQQAARAFGQGAVYLERYVEGARHVELQLALDENGKSVHLWERECSVQRRYQKVLEEAPSPALSRHEVEMLAGAAASVLASVGYTGLATVECVVDGDGSTWLLEVNPRLQVEHALTEEICSADLVEEQLRLAVGMPLSFNTPPPRTGHAIECRLYAEDPVRFLPSPGKVKRLRFPEGVRCDFGYDEADTVPPFYDPLLGKVISCGSDREEAIAKMREALVELEIDGVKTNIETHLRVLSDERFISGRYDTGLLASYVAHP